MSFYDYQNSKDLAREGYSFHALLMATIRQADTDNLAKLKAAFPQVHDEFLERYNAPGGALDDMERKTLNEMFADEKE